MRTGYARSVCLHDGGGPLICVVDGKLMTWIHPLSTPSEAYEPCISVRNPTRGPSPQASYPLMTSNRYHHQTNLTQHYQMVSSNTTTIMALLAMLITLAVPVHGAWCNGHPTRWLLSPPKTNHTSDAVRTDRADSLESLMALPLLLAVVAAILVGLVDMMSAFVTVCFE